MSNNIYRFDPSNYDSRSVDKPLSQLMREAETERSRQGARYIVAGWNRLMQLFGPPKPQKPQKAAPQSVKETPRLAA